MTESYFHKLDKALKYRNDLPLLTRSFFLKVFVICELHSLIFELPKFFIHQPQYRPCTGLVVQKDCRTLDFSKVTAVLQKSFPYGHILNCLNWLK